MDKLIANKIERTEDLRLALQKQMRTAPEINIIFSKVKIAE